MSVSNQSFEFFYRFSYSYSISFSPSSWKYSKLCLFLFKCFKVFFYIKNEDNSQGRKRDKKFLIIIAKSCILVWLWSRNKTQILQSDFLFNSLYFNSTECAVLLCLSRSKEKNFFILNLNTSNDDFFHSLLVYNILKCCTSKND